MCVADGVVAELVRDDPAPVFCQQRQYGKFIETLVLSHAVKVSELLYETVELESESRTGSCIEIEL